MPPDAGQVYSYRALMADGHGLARVDRSLEKNIACIVRPGEQYCTVTEICGIQLAAASRVCSPAYCTLGCGMLYHQLPVPPPFGRALFFGPSPLVRERIEIQDFALGMSTTWSTGELMRHQSQRPHARSAISYSTAHSKSVQSLLAQSIYGVTRYDDASAQYRVLVHQSPPVHTAPEAGSVQ